MMQPMEALQQLGSTRVIWIDDHFADQTAEQLAALLSRHIETCRAAGLDEYEDIWQRIEDEDANAQTDLTERLLALTSQQRGKIREKFYSSESDSGDFATIDLSDEHVQTVCDQLNIVRADRWSFHDVEQKITALAPDDAYISYIIDLNNAYEGQDNMRGLSVLKALYYANSNATAFLLTHAATTGSEAAKESELQDALAVEGLEFKATPPLCVIAKERLNGNPLAAAVSQGLRIAIKRAGLRRSVHEVLIAAESKVGAAFEDARKALLHVPPEQLDEYVVRRAVGEGVSELHVVERALTATMSESLRRLFATDAKLINSAGRLRELHSIELNLPQPQIPSKELEDFRKMELWEPRDLVNGSFAALACGDVFSFDADEDEMDEKRFILLVQPCDAMLRPKVERVSDAGFLVPLKPRPVSEGIKRDGLRSLTLPFALENKYWTCDFRNATVVRLSVLDLATLRKDGKVRYDSAQELPKAILPGQSKNGKPLLDTMAAAMELRRVAGAQNSNLFDLRCQLTLSSSKPFKKIANVRYVPAASGGAGAAPERLIWGIQRVGRVRMPFATFVLNSYLSIMGREAFDLDFLKPDSDPSEAEGHSQGSQLGGQLQEAVPVPAAVGQSSAGAVESHSFSSHKTFLTSTPLTWLAGWWRKSH